MDVATVLFILFIFCILLLGYVVVSVLKSDKKKKEFVKHIKVGDNCKLTVINGSQVLNSFEVIEIDDDDNVTVQLKVSKRWVYPPDNNPW